MATLFLVAGAKFVATSFALNAFASAALVTGASLVGSFIDSKLFGKTVSQNGPRLDEVRFTGSSQTSPVSRVAGRFRIGGNIIWSTRFLEVTTTETTSGGKGGGGKTKTTTFEYFVSFAVGLVEGPILDIGRIWADGRVLDTEDLTIRLYYGDETQERDPKITVVEGEDFTPAYRGLAYIVFEELSLEQFGNRIPQINVEVTFTVDASMDEFENKIVGVDLIPSTGEFVYGTTPVFVEDSGERLFENRHIFGETTNFVQSMQKFMRAAPNCKEVAIVCAWHGTDLRISEAQLHPKVELASKATKPYVWEVSGITRNNALVVEVDSDNNGFLGGAVADRAVFEAMVWLKDQGFNVMFYPFILMDIPPNNTLVNPYTDTAGQPAFPWRGRLTLSLAPGVAGSPDGTAAARAQVETFFGAAIPANFSSYNGSTINYTGPNEWSYRRMILHYAKLAASVPGGIDAFVIGTEMVALNQIRDETGAFPAVDEFVRLAGDVRTILGTGVAITYAADWSEWSNFRPTDGSGDVFFHLDKLWADPNIDAISIDNYMPLSDWRNTSEHLDAQNYDSIYELDYLKGNIAGGELFDWFYATNEDRDAQIRAPITDGAYDKPWVFRPKDLAGWWTNPHYNRIGGVEATTSTEWIPQSKPIWFSEVGCPAVQNGSNQPNVFFDPKSSESQLPYFSNGVRDDYIQRRFNQAHLEYWKDNSGTQLNPTGMVDPDKLFIWAWDARPYPEFPARSDIWADADNWRRGHWLNGRIALPEIKHYIELLFADVGVDSAMLDVSQVFGLVHGFAVTQANTIREILDPIMFTNFLESFESNGKLVFRHKGQKSAATISYETLIQGESGGQSLGGSIQTDREDPLDIPQEARIEFVEDNFNYDSNVAYYRNPLSTSASISESSVNILLDFTWAEDLAARLLQEVFIGREKLSFKMPPSMLRFDPTDVITLDVYGREVIVTLEDISEEFVREVRASTVDPDIFNAVSAESPQSKNPTPISRQSTTLAIMNLPLLSSVSSEYGVYFAGSGQPWGGGISIFRSADTITFFSDTPVTAPSIIGVTDFDFFAGPTGRWDYGNELFVTVNNSGTLSSESEIAVFQGLNSAALYNAATSSWEIVQWQIAEETGPNRYKLTKLLRGQLGTEAAMGTPLPAGSRFVVLDSSRLEQSDSGPDLMGLQLTWLFGPANDSRDSDTFRTEVVEVQGLGLRPYSPVHLKGTKSPTTNDITFSWTRRTRIGGDIWDNTDVPLNETAERYELDIYDAGGSVVIRTITITNVSATIYTEAMQITDFGSSQSQVDVEVFQISDTFGRGQGRRKTLIFPA